MLVVDDDEVIRQLIAVNLTLEGFDVATAVDGQDCLDKVTAIDPDVITLDIMMPRLDGWMTASLLRRNPETSTIKVVLITARAPEDDKTRGKQIGVDAYLTKPFDPSEMIRVVRELAGHPPVADTAYTRPKPRPAAVHRAGGRPPRPGRRSGAAGPEAAGPRPADPARAEDGPAAWNRPAHWGASSWDGSASAPKPSSPASPANRDRGIERASALATVGRAPSNAAVTKST